MNWLLIIIIIILLASALKGYQSGFIKTAFSLVSILVAIVVTTAVSPTLGKMLRKNDMVMDKVRNQVEEVISFDESIKKNSQETTFIENLSLPESIKKTLIENNNVEAYKAMAVDSFKEYIVSAIATIIINVISYVVCFVVCMIVLFILCHVLDLISKLPLLNEVNKTAGLFVGLLSGCVRVWIFFIILTLFGTTSLGENIFKMVNESPILTFIYNNNLLSKGIMNLAHIIF